MPYIAFSDKSGHGLGYYLYVSQGGLSTQTFKTDLATSAGNIKPYYSSTGSLSYNSTTAEFTYTDASGGVWTFYDLRRSSGSIDTSPLDDPASSDYSQKFGRFKGYTSPSGTKVEVTYNSSGAFAGLAQYVERYNASASSVRERFAYTYATLTNIAGASAPLLSRVDMQRKDGGGTYQTARSVEYEYYTGFVGSTSAADSNGRFGDLKFATVKDAAGATIDQTYYRYYKLTGTAYSNEWRSRGPTNDRSFDEETGQITDKTGGVIDTATSYTQNVANFGGTNEIAEYNDLLVFSMPKTVVGGAALSRLVAKYSNFESRSDAEIKPYSNYTWRYERWADWNTNKYNWSPSYHTSTRYRAIEESAQGGCSTCSGGLGTAKYEYAINPDGTGRNLNEINYNVWRMKTTEYLPDATNADNDSDGKVDGYEWADNDRKIVYLNEVGQAMLEDVVDVAESSKWLTEIDSSGTAATATLPNHGYSVGDKIIISGADQPKYNGVFAITGVTTNTFSYTLTSSPGVSASGQGLRVQKAVQSVSVSGATVTITMSNHGFANGDRVAMAGADAYYNVYTQEGASNNLFNSLFTVSNVTANSFQIQLPYESGFTPTGTIVVNKVVTEYLTSLRFKERKGGSGTNSEAGGQLVFKASPAAVTGYSETNPDLVGFNGSTYQYIASGAGLVERWNYADTTDGTISETVAGDVDGFFQSYTVSKGYAGTQEIQFSQNYFKRTAGGTSVYPIATETYYRNGNGTGNQIYKHSYTWYSGATQIYNETVEAPVITTAQNGPGGTTGVKTQAVYDLYGRLTWYMDEGGYLTQTEYDPVTGGVTTSVRDVDATVATVSSLSRSGSVATATATAHGYRVGDLVNIWGANQTEYNGWVTVASVPNTNTFTFTVSGTPASSATGTIKAGRANLSTLPSGWSTPSGGGLNLVTRSVLDAFGRKTKVIDPNGNATYTIYKDAQHEVRTYRGFTGSGTTGSTTGPIEIVREYRPTAGATAGQDLVYREWLSSSATPDTVNGAPTGNESISSSNIQSLKREITNDAGQVIAKDVYTVAPGSYLQASARLGISGSDFLETSVDYDGRGRVKRTIAPDGTITRNEYDVRGLQTSTWKGTGDTSTLGYWSPSNQGGSNLVKIASSTYDADGNLATSNRVLTHNATTGADTSGYQIAYIYDYRDRLIGTRGPDGVAASYALDNLGNTIATKTYADLDNDFLSGAIDTGELRAESTAAYDERGQMYRSSVFQVSPATGATPGQEINSLATDYWYDARGNQVKSREANGLQRKTSFDGANRQIATYLSTDATETSYSDALSAGNDHLIEQTATYYDKAGRDVLDVTYQRKNNTPSTGLLTSENSWSQSSVHWYDAADRLVETANYGSELRGDYDNNGVNYSPLPTRVVFDRSTTSIIDTDGDKIPDVAEGTPPSAPTSANETNYALIVSTYAYDAAGRLKDVTDNKSRITRTNYDLAGRKTSVVENYVDGTVNANEVDTDRTTQYIYDTWGRLASQVAVNPLGSGLGVQYQTTKFAYSDNVDRSWVSATLYPDSNSGVAVNVGTGQYFTFFGDDMIATTYDRLGRKVTERDQRGVTHTFIYDSSGRLQADTFSNSVVPTGVDSTVRAIGYSYDDLSRIENVTSYGSFSNTTFLGTGTPLNQVRTFYDGWGNVIKSFQSHSGPVNDHTQAGTDSPAVQYSYADGATGTVAKYMRLDTMTYPNGRVLKYNYGTSGSDDDALNRVDVIRDNTAATDLVDYNYVGAYSFIGEEKHPSVNGGLTLTIGFAGNLLTGWDRFGQTIKWQWRNDSGTTTELDRFDYKYDRTGNRLATDRNVGGTTGDDGYSESFEYDGLDRLVDYRRGTQDASGYVPKSPTSTSLAFRQTWGTLDASGNVSGVGLDALGNWKTFTQDSNGGTSGGQATQSRITNTANEIGSVTGNSPAWATPAYDAAGNMTTVPKGGGNESTGLFFVYDGWNRVAGISATATPDGDFIDVGEVQYKYDGLGRRVGKTFASGSTFANEDTYYSENYQVLETRRNGNASAYDQTVWDLRFIDAPVLRYRDANGTAGDGLEQTLYTTYDANFDVTGLVQSNQTFVERYVYTPYGDRTVLTGTFGARSATSYDQWLGHQGLRQDAETLTYYNRARQYSSDLGVFDRRDPLLSRYQDGLNLYQYLRSSPSGRTDPSGLLSILPRAPWKNDELVWPWKIPGKAYEIEKQEYGCYLDPAGGDYRHCLAGCMAARIGNPFLGAAGVKIFGDIGESDPADSAANWRGYYAGANPFNSGSSCRDLCKTLIVRPLGEKKPGCKRPCP